MIQCDSCREWRGRSCKLTGYRSTGKWKNFNCSGYKKIESQETLEGLIDA